MAILIQDIRYALRGLRSHPLFTVIAVGTLALGIGATSTLFTVVDAVLLRPLPFPEPNRIVSISERQLGHDIRVAPSADIDAWRAARSLSTLASYNPDRAVLTGAGDPLPLQGADVTPDFFGVIGVRPVLGRTFVAADASSGAADVVIIDRTLWQTRYGGDPDIVGRNVLLDGRSTTVVGVVNDVGELPIPMTFWRPLSVAPAASGAVYFYSVLARVRPGVTQAAVQHELGAIRARQDAARPVSERGATAIVMTLHDRMFGAVRAPLLLLFGAVTFLLLVACANVANLLLARAASRERDIAVRIALGATRWRLVRQMVAESVLLSLLGATLGMLLPVWAVGVFVKLSPVGIERLAHVQVDWHVAAFAAVVAVVTGLVFGALPASVATRGDRFGMLKDADTRSTGSRRAHGVRRALVAGELAATLLLLTGAGLLTRSFVRVLSIDPGYRTDHLLGAMIYLPRERYPTPAKRSAFYDALVPHLQALPGVRTVALADVLPSQGFAETRSLSSFTRTADSTQVAIVGVTLEYPRTIGLHVLAGRTFVVGDHNAVLLSASAAHGLFPHGHAVGQLLAADRDSTGTAARVVGVVSNVPQQGIEVTPLPQVYELSDNDHSVVVLRADGDVSRLEPMIQRAVSALDPLQTVSSYRIVDQALAKDLAPRRLDFLLMDLLAMVALLLAAVGLYGVTSFHVAQRTREIGIRVALGSSAGAVRGLVVRQSMPTILAGAAAGVVLSVVLTRTLSSMLYGVTSSDATSFIAAPLVLVVVALLACYIPARRASRVDPVMALRE